MEWTRSDTLALASARCAFCHGLGLRDGRDSRQEPCHCVLRQIFRACYARFRVCVTQDKYIVQTHLEIGSGTQAHYNWGRKDEEYSADFCLVSRRTLNDAEYNVFKFHFLLGADWRLCCRKLKIDRGIFFHTVYRIEAKLGRVYRELKPYGLYPLRDYFENSSREPITSCRRVFRVRPIRPPLAYKNDVTRRLRLSA